MRYEVIMEKGDISLIRRKQDLDEYAVVSGLDKEKGEWDYTLCYWSFGRYSNTSQAECLSRVIEYYRYITEIDYIPRDRLIELATCFKDKIIENIENVFIEPEENMKEFFIDEMEMENSELEFFGINLHCNDRN